MNEIPQAQARILERIENLAKNREQSQKQVEKQYRIILLFLVLISTALISSVLILGFTPFA
jgi:hypothetical protein